MTKVLKKIVIAICRYCGAEFTQRNTRAHFCSAKHRVYFNRLRNRMARETVAKAPKEIPIMDRVLGRVGPRRT